MPHLEPTLPCSIPATFFCVRLVFRRVCNIVWTGHLLRIPPEDDLLMSKAAR